MKKYHQCLGHCPNCNSNQIYMKEPPITHQAGNDIQTFQTCSECKVTFWEIYKYHKTMLKTIIEGTGKADNTKWLINKPARLYGGIYEVDKDGRKLYQGKFTSPSYLEPGESYEVVTVRFWAFKPTAAMRKIASGTKHPSEYADKSL